MMNVVQNARIEESTVCVSVFAYNVLAQSKSAAKKPDRYIYQNKDINFFDSLYSQKHRKKNAKNNYLFYIFQRIYRHVVFPDWSGYN